jgi:tetrahydrodipicolinate N-succinyltransferase
VIDPFVEGVEVPDASVVDMGVIVNAQSQVTNH